MLHYDVLLIRPFGEKNVEVKFILKSVPASGSKYGRISNHGDYTPENQTCPESGRSGSWKSDRVPQSTRSSPRKMERTKEKSKAHSTMTVPHTCAQRQVE